MELIGDEDAQTSLIEIRRRDDLAEEEKAL